MPESNSTLTMSYKLKAAESDVAQYCVSVLDTTEGLVANPGGAAAGKIAGVLQDETLSAGEIGAYAVAGVSLVKIASAVAVGDLLIINGTDGRVKPKGSSNASGTGIVGRAISAASSANSLVKCVLAIPCEITT